LRLESSSTICLAAHRAAEEEPVPNVAVDDIDLALLGALQADARAPIEALCKAAGVSRSTAYGRLAQLRESGVIHSLTVAVDPYRVGLSLAAVILLRTSTDAWRQWSSFAPTFDEMPEVEFAADLAGEFDMLLLARFRDADHLRAFLQDDLRRVPGIAGIRTLLVLDETPRRSWLLPKATGATGPRSDR
jgi:DNA-binding Lrp family transcriptional regulator